MATTLKAMLRGKLNELQETKAQTDREIRAIEALLNGGQPVGQPLVVHRVRGTMARDLTSDQAAKAQKGVIEVLKANGALGMVALVYKLRQRGDAPKGIARRRMRDWMRNSVLMPLHAEGKITKSGKLKGMKYAYSPAKYIGQVGKETTRQ